MYQYLNDIEAEDAGCSIHQVVKTDVPRVSIDKVSSVGTCLGLLEVGELPPSPPPERRVVAQCPAAVTAPRLD